MNSPNENGSNGSAPGSVDPRKRRHSDQLAPGGSSLVSTAFSPPTRAVAMPAQPANTFSHWQLARTHKYLIAAFVVFGLIAGVAYVILRTPLYGASTTVELVGVNQSFMGMSQVDPQAGTDAMSASVSNIQTQVKLLTSRTLLSRVSERMNLEMTPVTSSAPPADPENETVIVKTWQIIMGVRAKIPFLQKEPLDLNRLALRKALDSVSARGLGTTRLIEIQCESLSPEVSSSFANTLVAEHVAQSLSARSNVTQKTSQWMESQLEEAKARLQEANEKLRDFVQKSGMDFFPEQSTLADTKMRALQSDVSAVQADRIAKQSRWELARNTPLDSLPDVMNDPNLQSMKAQIAALRREMAQLTATLTPEHYKVQRIQAQITETEQTLEKEKAGLLKRVQSEYEDALRREKLLLAAYNSQTHSVASQTDKSAQYAMLKRDVETQQTLYNSLLQQSNQAALVALAPSSSVRVVDSAFPAPVPSNPRPFRDIPGSALAMGALGYGFLWRREQVRRKKSILLFDAPGHTLTVLGVPELGVIPSAIFDQPKLSLRNRLASRSLPIKITRSGFSLGDGNAADTAPIVPGNGNLSSLLAESFRQTVVSLLRTRPKDHNPVYVITSAYPDEGKTTLSANLASAMADIGQRVLLVDADLRRPNLHALFGAVKDHPGLSDILAGSDPVQSIDLDLYLQETSQGNLKVLTQGVASLESPALLFFSPRVEKIVALLQSRFDYIFLDTAPALAFPDARLWGKHADGVVLIVRSGVTTREGAASACQRFLDDGIPVLGTILNDWTPRDLSTSHYHYGYDSIKVSRKS